MTELERKELTKKGIMLRCPCCNKNVVFIGVHDEEGNYKGIHGCDYENDPWSGLTYAIHHEGYGDCILCTDGKEYPMGGVDFETYEKAIEEWAKQCRNLFGDSGE